MDGQAARMSGLEMAMSGTCSPVQKLANTPRLPLADDEFQIIIQRDEPSLAAERTHLSDMIDVHQRVAVDPPETGALEPLLEHLESLSGKVFALRRDDPHQVS